MNLEAYEGTKGKYYTASIVRNEPLHALEGWFSVPSQLVYLDDPYPDRWYHSGVQKIVNSLDRHSMWGVRKALGDDTGWRVLPW